MPKHSKTVLLKTNDIPVYCACSALGDIESITPNPRNPNKHSDDQVKLLGKIIRAHGWRAPITVSKRSGFIVRGHARLLAARHLQLDKVPVDYQDYASEAEEYADLIVDNRLSELSDEDPVELKDLINELEAGGYDITLTGYDLESLAELVPEPLKEAKEDDFDPSQEVATIVKSGEVWQLGRHRLMCGDSTVNTDVAKLMGSNKADMVFTDPPYGIDIVKNSGVLTDKGYKDVIGDDKPFDPRFLLELAENQIIFGGNYCADLLPPSRCWLVWDKREGTTTNDFADCELIWTSFKSPARIYPWLWNGWSKKSDIELDGKSRVHPTQKPVGLCAKIISDYSKNGIILDLFLGSGTTLIACEQLDRACYGMEIDEHYCDVVIARWEKYTGQKAVQA